MTFKIQMFLITVLVLALAVIINMVKRRELELKYVLSWMVCDITLIIFTCFPETMGSLAKVMGIYSPVNMIFFLGFLFALFIIFSLTVALSRVTEKVRRITQILAMLPEDVKAELKESGEQ